MEGLGRVLPCFLQGDKGADFYIQTNRIGPIERRREAVADKIRSKNKLIGKQRAIHLPQDFRHSLKAPPDCVDSIINEIRIDDRTIRCDTHYDVRPGLYSRLVITVKHIEEAAACERDSTEITIFRDG